MQWKTQGPTLKPRCPQVVFVTAATSSPFNLVAPMIGALVTDGGSLLGHPAITAREHGLPCVVRAGQQRQLAAHKRVRVGG